MAYEDMKAGIAAKLYTEEQLNDAARQYALKNTPWDDCKEEIEQAFKAGNDWVINRIQLWQELNDSVAKIAERYKNDPPDKRYSLKEMFPDGLKSVKTWNEMNCLYAQDDYTDEERQMLCEDCRRKCKYNKEG